MDLCDKYLHDYINIYPPMNDYLLYKKFFKKKSILPNHYSKQYIKKDKDFFEKYNKLIKDKKNDLLKCEEILKYDLDFDKKVKFFESSEYLLDIEENLLFIYYDICINKLTPLVNKNDYNPVMNRLKTLSSITNDIIKILKKGIEKNIIINKLIINSFIKKAQSILDDKKISPKNVPNNIKKQFIEYIKKYIVNNIKKLYLFIINDYLKYSKDNLGLCSYKYGKKYYEEISKYNTLSNLRPDNIHDIGLRHLKNDLSLKSNLAKKLKVKDIDDHVYKKEMLEIFYEQANKNLEASYSFCVQRPPVDLERGLELKMYF